MFKPEDEVVVIDCNPNDVLLSHAGLSVKVLNHTKDGSEVEVLTTGIKVTIAKGSKLFKWSRENATDIQQLVDLGKGDLVGIKQGDEQPIQEQADTVVQEETPQPVTEGEPEVVENPPEEVSNVAAEEPDESAGIQPDDDNQVGPVEEPDGTNEPEVSEVDESEQEEVVEEEIPEVETQVKETPTEEVTQKETKVIDKKPKQEDSMSEKKASMNDIIMPMLLAKKHTATEIASEVQKAFPDKYPANDEKVFKKLVQQIKGPRVYNAKQAGKDVAVVPEKKE